MNKRTRQLNYIYLFFNLRVGGVEVNNVDFGTCNTGRAVAMRCECVTGLNSMGLTNVILVGERLLWSIREKAISIIAQK